MKLVSWHKGDFTCHQVFVQGMRLCMGHVQEDHHQFNISIPEASKHHLVMNSMKLVIPLHSLYWSIHTKDESIRGTAFAFIFGVN